MCTAATYKTKRFFILEEHWTTNFSYGDQITITPRNYPFFFPACRYKTNATMRSSAWLM